MTKAEVAKLLAVLQYAYPNGRIPADDTAISLWYQMLRDLDCQTVNTAVMGMVATLKYPPSIADIREAVARAMAEARGDPDAGQAWRTVYKAIGRYGYYRPGEARAALGERMWKAIDMVGGWSHLCSTDEIEIVSAQFERRYKAMQEQERYKTLVPLEARERMKELAGRAQRQLEGA